MQLLGRAQAATGQSTNIYTVLWDLSSWAMCPSKVLTLPWKETQAITATVSYPWLLW